MLPHGRQPRHRLRAGVEVARPRVLDVADRRRDRGRQASDGGTKPLDVGDRGVDAEAGAYRTGHLAAVTPPGPLTVHGDLARAQAEEAYQVGVGAEAPVAHADGIFEREPGGHQGMGRPSTVNVATGRVSVPRSGPRSWTPGMAASPRRKAAASC